MTYVSIFHVVENIFGYIIDAMNLFVIEHRVGILSLERWNSVSLLWFVFEDIGNEDVLAKVLRQTFSIINLDAEVDLLVQELSRVID